METTQPAAFEGVEDDHRQELPAASVLGHVVLTARFVLVIPAEANDCAKFVTAVLLATHAELLVEVHEAVHDPPRTAA